MFIPKLESLRIPIEGIDDIFFVVRIDDKLIEDAKLINISVSSLAYKSTKVLRIGSFVTIDIRYKRINLELLASVLRAKESGDAIEYAIKIEEGDLSSLVSAYISSMLPIKSKKLLMNIIEDDYQKLESFSIIFSIFKNMPKLISDGDFIQESLDVVLRELGAARCSIYLINPKTNELKMTYGRGYPSHEISINYKLGLIGQVFISQTYVNLDTQNDHMYLQKNLDQFLASPTKTMIAYPFFNIENKVVGVVEFSNKLNGQRFVLEDEKLVALFAMCLNFIYQEYNPVSDISLLRRFTTPRDRKYALLGYSKEIMQIRKQIVKLANLEKTILISGEKGTGKSLLAKIIHTEGAYGNRFLKIVGPSFDAKELDDIFIKANDQVGGVLFENINQFKINDQIFILDLIKRESNVRSIFTLNGQKDELDSYFYEYISLIHVRLPALRHRTSDISPLIEYFMKKECRQSGLLPKVFDKSIILKMEKYSFPGNVRELKNSIIRLVTYNSKHSVITVSDFDNSIMPIWNDSVTNEFKTFLDDDSLTLKERMALIEKEIIVEELRMSGNKSFVAKKLGLTREGLRKKMKNIGLLTDNIYSKKAA